MGAFDRERLLMNFNGNPPALAASIRELKAESTFHLPEDYAKFLQEANGGEGFVGPNAYVILWRGEDLMSMNDAYHVREYAPGLVLFGSDGGGEAFAFNMRADGKPIVSVPFIGLDRAAARPLASNFNDFLEKLYNS
jgi:hypothetical protein